MNIQSNIELKHFNSWKVGGRAEFFCQPQNKQELLEATQWAIKHEKKVSVLSGGTNVLISDQGVKGLLIHLGHLKGIKTWKQQGRLYVSALAGTKKSEIMKVFLQHHLSPAVFLCGVPGDVGAGVVMNAGIRFLNTYPHFPKEFKDIVDEIKILKAQKMVAIKGQDINWQYRKGWKGEGVIVEVTMSWPLKPISDIQKIVSKEALKRAQSQPLTMASCGSVFKNPKNGQGAGALIEQCGLKAYQIGGALVSKKHANFIVNVAEAQALHIHKLIQHIQKVVKNKHGVVLEPEIKYFGQWEI